MNRIDGSNIVDNLPESNSIIEKIQLIAEKIKQLRAADDIQINEQEFIDIVGNATVTVGIRTGYGTIKTFRITKEGVKINEELCRQRTVDNYKGNA